MGFELRCVTPLALALLSIGGCLEPIPEHTLAGGADRAGALAGKVLEACTFEPIEGAAVTSWPGELQSQTSGPDTVTKADGAYQLGGLRLGSIWRLFARKTGYLLSRENLVVGDSWQKRDLYIAVDEKRPPARQAIDLLLVIGNSAGMAEQQRRFAAAFPSLVSGIFEGLRGNRMEDVGTSQELDLRVGATAADVAAPTCPPSSNGGKLTFSKGCPAPTGNILSWTLVKRVTAGGDQISISDEANGWSAQADDAGPVLSSAAGCLTQLGEAGCVYQQPIGAARRALQPDVNASFRRNGAALIIIIVTDDDDCSPDELQGGAGLDRIGADLSCFERNVGCMPAGPDPGPRWNCRTAEAQRQDVDGAAQDLRFSEQPLFVGVVAGDRGPVEFLQVSGRRQLASVCSSGAYVVPSFRLREFVDRLRPFAGFVSLCGDLKSLLSNLGAQAAQSTLLWPCAKP